MAQQVADALAAIPGGANLEEYFGTSGQVPQQPAAESRRSRAIIDRLRNVSAGRPCDMRQLFKDVSGHVAASGADPDTLRALMRASRNRQRPEGGK